MDALYRALADYARLVIDEDETAFAEAVDSGDYERAGEVITQSAEMSQALQHYERARER